jgi:broad specificity phosphatase PhoE
VRSAKRIFLLRHGSTGTDGRYVGATDLPLSREGAADLAGTAAFLRRQEIDTVFCSPMRRCRQTHELLGLACPVEIVDDLREIDFGRWEGQSFEEICKKDEKLVQEWAQGTDDFTFPEGESIAHFALRVSRVMDMLMATAACRPLLVAHGGVIRHLLCTCLGIAPEKSLLFNVRFGRCAIIDLHSQGGVLAGLNVGDW